MKVLCIIQARMGSKRLPGKVLLSLDPSWKCSPLSMIVDCASRSKRIWKTIVATTTLPQDDILEDCCAAWGVACFRGSSENCLERFYDCARTCLSSGDAVVRLTADCPLHDSDIIDDVVGFYAGGNYEFVTNSDPPTYPDGMDVEVMSFDALAAAYKNATLPDELEHCTLYIRRRPGIFRSYTHSIRPSFAWMKLSLDDEKDLENIRSITSKLGSARPSLLAIKTILDGDPVLKRSVTRAEYADRLVPSDQLFCSQELIARARRAIPGVSGLLSKKPERILPVRWPTYFSSASGANVIGSDGIRYIDGSYAGLGACVLGYADPDVDAAAKKAIDAGVASTLLCPEDVELAELLVELHPWAQSVRYARSGGEALAMAVRIARAASGRDNVVFSGYHGWHDWYVAANLADEQALDDQLIRGVPSSGVPRALKWTSTPFKHSDTKDFDRAFAIAGNVGVVVVETMRESEDVIPFLRHVVDHAHAAGAVVIFDEVSSGFRICCGGAHLVAGIAPDIAVFSKAIANGYAMSAVVGTRQVMEHVTKSWVSSTNWTERIGPAAAIATIRKFQREHTQDLLVAIGRAAKLAWRRAAAAAKLEISVGGINPLAHFAFVGSDVGEDPQAMRTLYTLEMLKLGWLAPASFYAMAAHTANDLERFETDAAHAFGVVADAAMGDGVEASLPNGVAEAGFARLA